MRSRRRLVLSATTLAVAFIASTAPATGVGATVPPAVPPSASAPVSTNQSATDSSAPAVESWALSPAASTDPNQAGSRSELSYVSDNGATIGDAVTLYNFGTVPLTFKVYATRDAFNDDQGQFELLPGDKKPTDVGTWVTFPQGIITLLPGTQATMPITIKIPADAAPGDHVGAILASSPTLGTGKQGQIVTLDRRTGTRLYVRVNGDLLPELAVDNVATTYDQSVNPLGGSATVTFRLANRGNIRLSGTPTVKIAGPLGLFGRKIKLPDINELLPGEDVTLTAHVANVAASMIDTTTVRVTPHGSGDSGTGRVPTGNDTTFAPPITVLLVLLVVVLLVLARRIRRRRVADLVAVPELQVRRTLEDEPQHQPT